MRLQSENRLCKADILVICSFMLLLFTQCTGQPKTSKVADKRNDAAFTPGTFSLPSVPDTIRSDEQRAAYVVLHYWDNLNAADTLLLNNEEVTEQAFSDYINLFHLVPDSIIDKSGENLMNRCSASAQMTRYILELGEKYLYDGNSPYHNDRYLFHILRHRQKGLLDPTLDSHWNSLYKLVSINNPGQKASEISWLLPSGKVMHLSEVKSKYTILFFNDPDCAECRKAKQKLAGSNIPDDCKVVSIYTENDISLWKKSLKEVPSSWINGVDDKQNISLLNKFDLKMNPTLYLLDRDKSVLLKDATVGGIIEYLHR